jgi:hypothetical protein
MNETIVVKYYINEILEFKTISILILHKNMLGTLGNLTSTSNEPL